MLYHPEVATRDCGHCREFLYDIDSGMVRKHQVDLPDGTVGEVPTPRPKGILPPCELSMGCPKGKPDAGIELSAKNWQAYAHFQRCRAVNRFPEDSIVERNAGIIDGVLRRHSDGQQRLTIEYLRLCATKPNM